MGRREEVAFSFAATRHFRYHREIRNWVGLRGAVSKGGSLRRVCRKVGKFEGMGPSTRMSFPSSARLAHPPRHAANGLAPMAKCLSIDRNTAAIVEWKDGE